MPFARRYNRPRKPPPRGKQPKKKRGKRKPSSGTREFGTIGKAVATGVRTLLSVLPGSGISVPIADFLFHAFGYADSFSVPTADNTVDAPVVRFTGVIGGVSVCPATLISATKLAVFDSNRNFGTRYMDGRIVKIRVDVVPSNVTSSRSGFWILAIQPFFTKEDAARYSNVDTPNVGQHALVGCYKSVTGPASVPLSLSYSPRVHDGFAFSFSPIEIDKLAILIRYEQIDRVAYTEFTADQFACELTIRGTVETRCPENSVSHTIYDDRVNDVFKGAYTDTHQGFSCVIQSTDRSKVYHFDGKTACLPNGDKRSCHVTGKVIPKMVGSASSSISGLEVLTIDE